MAVYNGAAYRHAMAAAQHLTGGLACARMQLVKAALCAALYPNVVKVIIPPDKGRGKQKKLRKEDIHFHVRREKDEESSDEEATEIRSGVCLSFLYLPLRVSVFRSQSRCVDVSLSLPLSLSCAATPTSTPSHILPRRDMYWHAQPTSYHATPRRYQGHVHRRADQASFRALPIQRW